MFLMYNNSMKKTYVHHNANDADFTLNNILDISNQGFWDWNVATGHVYRSIGWFHMLGYDYDTCKNDVFTWEDIIHEDDYPHVMAHFEACIIVISQHMKPTNTTINMSCCDIPIPKALI
jgi:PAS domain-containing protein